MLEYLHCGILQKGNYRWAWQGWDFQMPMSVPPSATATAIASGALTRFAKNWIFDWIWFAFVLTIWPRPRLHSHSTHSTLRKASIAAAGGGGGAGGGWESRSRNIVSKLCVCVFGNVAAAFAISKFPMPCNGSKNYSGSSKDDPSPTPTHSPMEMPQKVGALVAASWRWRRPPVRHRIYSPRVPRATPLSTLPSRATAFELLSILSSWNLDTGQSSE